MVLGKRSSLRTTRLSFRRPGSRGSQNRRKETQSFSAKKEKWGKLEKTFDWEKIKIFFPALGIILLSLIIVATLSFCFVYGYRYATSSNYFLLKTVAIQGNKKLSSREILDITQIDDGTNLLALSIDGVEESLSLNPWIKNVSVARVLPETLKVTVQTKDPAFWVLRDKTIHYADGKGHIIAPLDPGEVSPLPILEVEKGAEDVQELLPDLIASLHTANIPLAMDKISVLRLSASRGVEFYVNGGRLKITVGLEEWLANLDRLAVTIRDLSRRGELRKVRSIRAQGSNVWVETSGVAVSG